MTDVAALAARFRVAYDGRAVLDVDLALPGRGITAVFGPSGSGKTTLLRCIAGLQRVAGGRLSFDGDVWQDDGHCRPAHERPVGYVFQEASLFAHLTARGNLAYATQRSTRRDDGDRVRRVVALMGIGPILDRYPSQLSGGEQQRVAIARALLIAPRLLLMDEPLASLDPARKREVLPYLERLRSEYDLPMLYVSHALDEVARLADHLVVLEAGRVLTGGPLAEVFARLDLPTLAGDDAGVIVDATVVERDDAWQLARVAFDGGDLWLRDQGVAVGRPIRVRVLARDVSVALDDHAASSIQNRLPAEVVEIGADADRAMSLLRLRTGGVDVVSRVTRRAVEQLQLAPGRRVWAQVKSVAIVR